jgi:ferric-dicitrate binding protein FerR (iron transport regulator)
MAESGGIDKEKLDKLLAGLTNETDKEWLESLFSNGENDFELRKLMEEDWLKIINSETETNRDLNFLLDRIHDTLRRNKKLRQQRFIRRSIQVYMKAAAILLLPVIIAAGLLLTNKRNMRVIPNGPVSSTIYAPLGARTSFILPDGTTGMLNSGSSLSYSQPFNNNRQVNLEGEAWLDVKHDEANPFLINAANSVVRVLGTSLNVSAYSSENYIEVVLAKGKVEFLNKDNNEIASMIPSQRLVFRDGHISSSYTDPGKYTSWTEGKLVFRGDPMEEVARRLERWYNIRVVIKDSSLLNYSFRAIFEDDKIEEVMRFISMTSPIRYEISPRKLLDDGTFEKQIINMYLKK